MRVKLDENLPRSVIGPLTDAGHDADTVVGEGLGGATDDAVFVAAQQAGRLLLTLDRGFGDIRRYPPGTHAGVVVLRLAEQSPAAVGAAVRRPVTEHVLDDLAGTVAIVEPERLRIRRALPSPR